MSYDIGIGLCTDIQGREVSVGLDSAMLNKFRPDSPWLKSGTGSLTFSSRFCSTKRMLKIGDEVYLDSAAIAKKAEAKLAITGAAESVQVDLRALLRDLDPMPAPTPRPKRPYGSFPNGIRK
ncbi:MAG TPA: hypothetical protein VJ806_08350 [Luteimonas sp.]|nr:hypothetical protein [Luteimonas sp.]